MAERDYRKLAGRGQRKGEFFTWHTLWLGRDHILQVEHSGYSEEYKRFYFADIQSISMHKTSRAQFWTIFCLVMIGIGATVGITLGYDGTNGAMVQMGAIGTWIGLWVVLMLVNFAKGPGCACFIQTAVQQEQLPSLKRVKKARRIIAQLRELIGSTQGLLGPEEAHNRFAATAQTPSSTVVSPENTPSSMS
jgi:hypothetical protein